LEENVTVILSDTILYCKMLAPSCSDVGCREVPLDCRAVDLDTLSPTSSCRATQRSLKAGDKVTLTLEVLQVMKRNG